MRFPKIHDVAGLNDRGRGVAVSSEGDVFVAGHTGQPSDFALWRLDDQGELADGFPVIRSGDAGGVHHDYGYDVAIGADDTVWAVGSSMNRTPDDDFALWKFDADGQLADDFPIIRHGDGGGDSIDKGWGVAVAPDGHVWAVGSSMMPEGRQAAAVWRFDEQGVLAEGFPRLLHGDAGGDGRDHANAVAIDAQGYAWVVGWAANDLDNNDAMIWRLTPGGETAPGFPVVRDGDAGGFRHDYAYGVAIDEHGNGWVSGSSFNRWTESDIALWKVGARGTVAPGFPVLRHGDAGGERNDSAFGVATDGQGAVFVAGDSMNERQRPLLVLWRFE